MVVQSIEWALTKGSDISSMEVVSLNIINVVQLELDHLSCWNGSMKYLCMHPCLSLGHTRIKLFDKDSWASVYSGVITEKQCKGGGKTEEGWERVCG